MPLNNTGNPLPSSSPLDREDNSIIFDELVNSKDKDFVPDRFGEPVQTLRYLANLGNNLPTGILTANDNFADNFAYRGASTDADLDDFVKDGNSVLVGSTLNSPFDPGSVLFLSCFVFGSFRLQRLVSRSNLTDIQYRWGSLSGGVYTWNGWQAAQSGLTAAENFDSQYAFRGLIESGSADDLEDEGHYLLGNGVTGLPTDAPSETVKLTVSAYGAFRVQQLFSPSQPKARWQRQRNFDGVWGTWENIHDQKNLTANDNFAIDYAFRGLIESGSINDLTNEGKFLVLKEVTDSPPDAPSETVTVSVTRTGAFVVQHLTAPSRIGSFWQRRGRIVSGSWVFDDWADVGGSESSLAGKNIVFLGDSLIEREIGGYPEIVSNRVGAASYKKIGFGGCRASAYGSQPDTYDHMCMYRLANNIATGNYTSLLDAAILLRDTVGDDNVPQATELSQIDWTTVDYLFLAWGANDWTSACPAGDATPTPDGSTYSGSLAYAIEEVQKAWPHLQIGLISPSFRLTNGGPDPELNSDTVEYGGRTLVPLVESLELVRKKYRTPVCDMYYNGGVNKYNYFEYIPDGVHPADPAGVQLWGDKVSAWAESEF